MALVINNVVKMEWNKDLWLQTSSRGGSPSIFIMAAHKYVNKDGKTISVIFVPDTAFLFVDDAGTENEDIWTAEDLRATLKSLSNISSGVKSESINSKAFCPIALFIILSPFY